MGYMRHHAIVVTGMYGDYIDKARAKAVELFSQRVPEWSPTPVAEVTEITPVVVNGTRSFMVAADGSKEGWGASDAGDKARAEFVEYLEAQIYDDLSSPLEWVEVQYGDENKQTKIISDSDAKHREAHSDRSRKDSTSNSGS